MRSKLNIQKLPKTRNQKLFEIWLLFFSSPESQVSDPAKVIAKKMLQLEGGAVNG